MVKNWRWNNLFSMPPFLSDSSTPPADDGASVGDWQRSRRGALNERAQKQALTQADYQPGQATTGGQTNLNITRRELSDAGADRLANARGLRDSAAALNQARNEQRSDKQQLSVGNALRQARQIRRDEQQQARSGKTDALGAAVASVAGQTITAEFLKQSWLNLITSFGLTLLYINFHYVARYFAGSQMFCRFGMEWFSVGKLAGGSENTSAASKPAAPKAESSDNKPAAPAAAGGKSAKEYATELASKPIELLELMVLGLCDILALTILVGAAVFIFFIVGGWLPIVINAVT